MKTEDPEKVRHWDQAIRILKRGDHYLPVLWNTTTPSEHPIRDFLKPVGVGMLIAMGVGIAAVFAAKYNIDSHRFGIYAVAVAVGIYLFATGAFRLLYRVAAGWFRQGTTNDGDPN